MSILARNGQRSFKVPKENNRFLCWPSAKESQVLIDGNRAIFESPGTPQWIVRLRHHARREAIRAATEYTSEYTSECAASRFAASRIGSNTRLELEKSQLILGGHQPELFHPGVWFKNFLLAKIGQQTGSTSLHVIIDHDTARSDSLRVPSSSDATSNGRSHRQYFQKSVPLPIRMDSQPRMSWHATRTQFSSSEAWQETKRQIAESLASCGLETSILVERSRLLETCIRDCVNFSDAFSRFRHLIELDNGIRNLEVPLGRLCQEPAFGVFVHHCVRNAEDLWLSYNECRTAYRERHGIRNPVQPVIELQRERHCIELPFWIYRDGGEALVDRQRLWIAQGSGESLILCNHPVPDRRTITVELPLDESKLTSVWQDIAESGICIRPRALMTTMYLRCFLADLFVHGIGGGTYDELTDAIIAQWLGIQQAPVYLTSSASLHLPLEERSEDSEDGDWLENLRELQLIRSAPERFLDRSLDPCRRLFEEHAQLLSKIPPRGHKRPWHQQMVQIKHRIEDAIIDPKRMAFSNHERLLRERQQDKIRKSREYSFVLFEERDVVARLSRLADEAMAPQV